MGDAIKVVAIDIGGTNIRATAIDETGTVLYRDVASAELLRHGDPIAVLTAVIRRASDRVGGSLAAAVIGAPGILDASRRGIVRSPNLPAFEGPGIADTLERACGIPVILDHDATLQTRGEAARGSAAGRNLVLGVYFGTGVGGAFLDHGQLTGGIYRMQLGHVPLRGEGKIGTGGAIDCVEAYASGAVLEALAAEHKRSVATLFSEPSKGALEVALRTFVHDQALTIALAMTLTDPEIVVIGGGVTEMLGYPFDDLVSQINGCISPVLGKGTRPIVRATLGPAAASWGALHLVCNALKQRQDGLANPLGSAAN